MFSQKPSPPRYVLNVDTGKWSKQVVVPETKPKESMPNIQSTLDLLLYHAMHTAKTQLEEEGKRTRVVPDVAGQIATFEARHNIHANALRSFSLSRRGGCCSNPVVGLLCGIPLYDVYTALTKRKGEEWDTYGGEPDPNKLLRLSLDELFDVCTSLVKPMVNYSYVRDMFTMLPSDGEDDDNSVPLSCFFSFLVENAFHPTLNRNVEALFRAFDPEGTGVISEATLASPVLNAFAELNLFGHLRGEWERMASTLEIVGNIDYRIVDNIRLLTPEATRAVLCSSPILYDAMENVDLDGSKLKVSS